MFWKHNGAVTKPHYSAEDIPPPTLQKPVLLVPGFGDGPEVIRSVFSDKESLTSLDYKNTPDTSLSLPAEGNYFPIVVLSFHLNMLHNLIRLSLSALRPPRSTHSVSAAASRRPVSVFMLTGQDETPGGSRREGGG